MKSKSVLFGAGFILAALATAATADKQCSNVYNPMTQKWEYQCVDRPGPYGPAPVCHQEYDPMNQTWVTVCN